MHQLLPALDLLATPATLTPKQKAQTQQIEQSLLAPCCYSQSLAQHMSPVAKFAFGVWHTYEKSSKGDTVRNIKIMEHSSLDGVIQHSADDNDFPYRDWTVPNRTPAGRDAILAAYGESFDLLLGRRTYDIWSGFWPKAPRSPMADGINAARKYIATHRPESLAWGPVESLGPDIVESIRRIKSQDGPYLILWGSSTLTSTLLEHGLADEVLLVVYPVLLGTGKRIFAEGTPPRSFELVSTKALASGVIINTYRPNGPLRTGAMGA